MVRVITRGGKPKPTHRKLIEGNPAKRPIRTGPEPPVTAMPDPPGHLNADSHTEWDRVARGLHALRLLEPVDRAALAAYCTAYTRWVQAEWAIAEMGERDMLTGGLMMKTSNGNTIRNPPVGTANKTAFDMVRYAAKFGMEPSARVRPEVDGSGTTTSKGPGLIGGVETGS